MEILKVKERRLNEELIGYMINSKIFIPVGSESQELKDWLAEGNVPEPEFTEEDIQKQELQVKINEAKQYLASTDHKFYNSYKPKEGEDLVEIERLRDEAREFIRANDATAME